MCDESAFHKLVSRVDELEKKMAVMESTQTAMRQEMKDGFTSVKTQLEHIYAERAEWSKWMRENLPNAAKWVGKWIVILTGVAIGVSNLRDIVAVFGDK